MNKVLISYAHITHYNAQKDNCRTGTRFGGFDNVIPYNDCDLEDDFKKANESILSERKGAGFWLWKPYIILKTMNMLNEGDYVFYNDSVIEWLKPVDPLINVCATLDHGIMLFHTDPVPTNEEYRCTKRDAFVYMDCDSDKYIHGLPLYATFQLYRVCERSIRFVEEMLNYCTDRRILTDDPNTCGLDNYPGFKYHRHDQSVLSLMQKKWDLPTHRDPTQQGNAFIKPTDFYEQIMRYNRRTD